MKWFERDLEIRYADTDQMGIVHNCVFPIYCEMGRTDFCSQAGMPYHHMEKAGYFLMVAESLGRYRAPVRYGDEIYIKSGISRLRRNFIAFDYEIRFRCDADTLVYTGSSKHMVTRGMDPCRMPDDWFQMLSVAAEMS